MSLPTMEGLGPILPDYKLSEQMRFASKHDRDSAYAYVYATGRLSASVQELLEVIEVAGNLLESGEGNKALAALVDVSRSHRGIAEAKTETDAYKSSKERELCDDVDGRAA